MNAEDSLKLARRFIGLPLEKRQVFLQALQKEGVDFSRFPIPAGVAVEDRQALSYAQQRMWFLWQLDPASAAYNLPGAVRLKGELNLGALERGVIRGYINPGKATQNRASIDGHHFLQLHLVTRRDRRVKK
jgi:hypothetical protein